MKILIYRFITKIKYLKLIYTIRLTGKKRYINKQARKRLGYSLNLKKPQLYNEKVNYRKMNYSNPLFDICSNKLFVRYYVSTKIDKKYLIPLIGYFKKPSQINLDELPQQFVIKTTHGSGGYNVILVHDKNLINWKMLNEKLDEALKLDYGKIKLETWYSATNRYLIVEKMLQIDNSYIEFKVYCFWKNKNFRAIIRVIHDRYKEKSSSFYDENWNYLDIRYQNDMSHKKIMRPEIHEEILRLSKSLSSDFDHVRVDFIYTNNKLYFGELTFADTSGFVNFKSKETDLFIGNLWSLE